LINFTPISAKCISVMMNIRQNYIFSLSITMLVLLFSGIGKSQHYNPKATTQKFASALQIINFAYVDTINEVNLVEKAIIATLKELDPHSQYISKNDLKKANEPLQGNFEGIGISFQLYRDTILVISPVPGGPAEKLGIKAGDKIVKINNESATGVSVDNNYVFKRLRGDKGTIVNISVMRKGRKNLIEYAVQRDKIPIHSIDASFIASSGIGYIKLNRFSRTTMDEFRMAIGELKDQGMEDLIMDLRGNSGGYLDVAIDLSDEFLGQGKLVLYTEGTSSPRRKYKSSFRGNFKEGKVVILIDEGSASASEIVAGALQDWDRALVVGRRSFGKGLVQRPYYLPDSSVIRLTVARYFTPTGRCIQKPYDKGYENYYEDLVDRLEGGELTDETNINFPDSLKYYTPQNRIVYGGGGIMPDVFVPWDSTQYTDFYVDLLSKGVFNDFVLDYVDRERSNLMMTYPNFIVFNNRFDADNHFLEQFLDFAADENLVPQNDDLKLSSKLIRYQLKALIGRNLFEFKSYFQVLSEIDEGFQKAVQVLKRDSHFAELKDF